MTDPKDDLTEKNKGSDTITSKRIANEHLGSSNAFEETENPLSRDPDNISDEKLDEMLDDESEDS